jgi:hypothetical protein
MYTYMVAGECESFKAGADESKTYGNVTCCSESLCNKPDPDADPEAVVMDTWPPNNDTRPASSGGSLAQGHQVT